jgi:formylglycine-generating enzyme required for sulfatase activity
MATRQSVVRWATVVAALLLFWAPGCSSGASNSQATGNLDAAIKARTQVTELAYEAAALDAQIRSAMRKVLAKAESKQMEGNIYLTKDKYGEAVQSFEAAVVLYRQVVDGKKVLERLAESEKKVSRARKLAEGASDEAKLKEARSLETNAQGYFEAGEIEAAVNELAKAQKTYEALAGAAPTATLEEAVAARTAMLAARKQIKTLSEFPMRRPATSRVPAALRQGTEEAPAGKAKKGTFSDILAQATGAESDAGEALENREYAPAKALFVRAEQLYRQAAILQAQRDRVLATAKAAEDNLRLADAAFKTEVRPASFERAKQALADARKAVDEDDLGEASRLFGEAAELAAKARGEAELVNELGKAQGEWAAAVAAADENLLAKNAAAEWAAVKQKATQAEAQAAAGKTQAAAGLYSDAVKALKVAVAQALTRENAAKAAPIIAQVQAARDKFLAEDLLAQLETLIPSDPRLAGLRAKVDAMPGPAKNLVLNLGGAVTLKMALIRPGKFMMGDEKNRHEVTLSKPFYVGVTEVTQAQYQAVMGTNPSNFKGETNPVEQVSWNDATEFCKKLSEKTRQAVRLPTEAEWEYACRAGTATAFSFGDSDSALGDYAWYSANSSNTTHPVGQKKPNAWGLYDMHGNLWEWCADWYGDYPKAAVTDPQGAASGTSRVLRGGSWFSNSDYCRAAHRDDRNPVNRNGGYGFRVVVSVAGMDLK